MKWVTLNSLLIMIFMIMCGRVNPDYSINIFFVCSSLMALPLLVFFHFITLICKCNYTIFLLEAWIPLLVLGLVLWLVRLPVLMWMPMGMAGVNFLGFWLRLISWNYYHEGQFYFWKANIFLHLSNMSVYQGFEVKWAKNSNFWSPVTVQTS